MLKGRYFEADDVRWAKDVENADRRYIDQDVDGKFNSYDSMDKYVLVLDFKPSIDNRILFNGSVGRSSGFTAAAYNILGDAGYIPHFAYQSLVKYADGDDGGTAYTWKNEYLAGKQHMQFELLGIDDADVPVAYDFM